MAHLARKLKTSFTWADYQTWPDDERWELIGGEAVAMSPAPTVRHQSICVRMLSRIERQLAGRPCQPFIAPTDVRLSDSDVVQPDILVVCDRSKIKTTHIEGAPDLVVEVLSPATSVPDLRQKKALYEKSGVREYLVLDPLENYAIRFLLEADGAFDKGTVFAADEMLTFGIFSDIAIPLWEVFDVPGPADAHPPAAE